MKKRATQILFNNLAKMEIPKGILFNGNRDLAYTLNRNLQSYGYTLDKDCMDRLSNCSKKQITDFWEEAVDMIKTYTMGEEFQNATLFYPNFPDEVMALDEVELYSNSLAYYFCQYNFDVNIQKTLVEEKQKRLPYLDDFKNLRVIAYGNEQDLFQLMKNRIYSQSMSIGREDELIQFKNMYPDSWQRIYDKDMKFASKENMIKFANLLYDDKKKNVVKYMIKDTPDILRFIAARSNINLNDDFNKISLAMNPNQMFLKLDKDEKMFVRELLDKSPNLYQDIWKNADLWKKAMRYIGMEKHTSPRVQIAFHNLAQNKKVSEFGRKIKTPSAQLTEAISELHNTGSTKSIIQVSHNFPGLYAANFKRIIDNVPKRATVFGTNPIDELTKAFEQNCTKLPVSDLLKIGNYFERCDDWDLRVFTNSRGKSFVAENIREKMDILDKNKILSSISKTINENVKGTKEMGKVYIDPELKNRVLPLRGERDSNHGAILTKYSSIPMTDKNLLAFAIHWKNLSDNSYDEADIDLSVNAYDENMNKKSEVYYSNMKEDWAVHSGDYIDGKGYDGNGAMEMIICDKEKMKENGIRYLLPSVTGYSCPFSEAENVKFIHMEKDGELDYNDVDTKKKNMPTTFCGEPVEISQIKDPISLNAKATHEVPFIYDVEKNKYIWLDSSLNLDGIGNINNPESMKSREAFLYKALHNEYPDMYQLFLSYTKANGEITHNIEEADTIFVASNQKNDGIVLKENVKIITAQDIDLISKEFCASQQKIKTPVIEKGERQIIAEEEIDKVLEKTKEKIQSGMNSITSDFDQMIERLAQAAEKENQNIENRINTDEQEL